MPKLNQIAVYVIGALAMAGCASSVRNEGPPPAVQPVLSVQDAVTPEGMFRLGRYYEGQARYDMAINAYREAIRRDPLMVQGYTALGTSLAAQQRYDEAIREFQAAIVLAPNAAHLHNNLGYAYLLSGQTEQAVKALEEAQRLEPAHAKSAENLRVARGQPGKSDPQPVSSPNTNVAMQPVTMPQTGTSLVEVTPQVFELRMPPKARKVEKIEAVPLPPIKEPRAGATTPSGFKLEIANGNGVLGLAKRVAGRLNAAGVRTARLTNQRPFTQPTTEVQYREGYAAAATALAAKLQHPVQVTLHQDLASHIAQRILAQDQAHVDMARKVVLRLDLHRMLQL